MGIVHDQAHFWCHATSLAVIAESQNRIQMSLHTPQSWPTLVSPLETRKKITAILDALLLIGPSTTFDPLQKLLSPGSGKNVH